MNYHDAYGVPGVVTRMFNNYGPRQNPRYVTGTIITQALTRPEIELGALEPLRDFCFTHRRRSRPSHGRGTRRPGDLYVYGQGENISMADWCDLILTTGAEHGFWPADRHVVTDAKRLRPGVTDVMALRVGYEKLHRETGWAPKVSWEEGVLRTIHWYAENRERWIGRVDWQSRRPRRATVSRILVTGGGGFLGSHLVERLQDRGRRRVRRAAARLRPDALRRRRAALRRRAAGASSSTSPPRSAGSARTAPIPAATGTRT